MLGGSRPPGRRRPARCGDVRHDGAPLRPSPDHRGRPRPARRGLRANALLGACGARGRLRPPISPSRSRAARTLRSTASSTLQSATPPWSYASAWPSGVAHHVEPDAHKGPYGSGAFDTPCESSVHLLNLRCIYRIFGASVNHFPFGLSCSGAPKFSKCTEDEKRCELGAQRFKELGAYRANQRGPHIARTSLQSHHDS